MTIRNLQNMFDPSSVVLVGASRQPGSVGNWLARNLGQGFGGKVDFVNPKGARSRQGLPSPAERP